MGPGQQVQGLRRAEHMAKDVQGPGARHVLGFVGVEPFFESRQGQGFGVSAAKPHPVAPRRRVEPVHRLGPGKPGAFHDPVHGRRYVRVHVEAGQVQQASLSGALHQTRNP